MSNKNVDSVNVFEQISQICRDFRNQISQGRSPRIEKYLSAIQEEGRENLFSNLLEIELRFRQSKGQSPSSEEYLKRFSQYAKQVRRAFFEPTMASVDSGDSCDDGTRSLKVAFDASEHTLTFQIPDANRLGDYELIRELGRGGMGVVYEARHTKTNNRVALKTLPTGGSGQEVNAEKLYRFRKEFRRLSEINHPNLVGMQTLEVDGSQWFFTMDLIDGEDFLSYVRPNDQLDKTRLRDCLKQLAKGIMALHREGIIHRDLKPGNVLVAGDGLVSILDFGLASAMYTPKHMSQTKSGMFAGTPPYAAPEQLFGERTKASDWYAFGTILYEALIGSRPFDDRDPVVLLRKKQEQDPPVLASVSELPADLAELCDGLIRRKPADRFLAEEIANRLGLELETRSNGTTLGPHDSVGSTPGKLIANSEKSSEQIVLVGREQQLAQLETIMEELCRAKNPQVVWVTGLSGQGKSSLAEEFLAQVTRADSATVLAGRCYDRESIPFKVVDVIIDRLASDLRTKEPQELHAILPTDIVYLAKLFPVLKRIPLIETRSRNFKEYVDERQAKFRAFAAFLELLANVSKQKPLLIFVDDLQWGDADSASIIFNVLASEVSPQVLFLGSYRSDEAEESEFLKAWSGLDFKDLIPFTSSKIQVADLSEKEVVDFIKERIGRNGVDHSELAKRLFEWTKGNPYFLEQLVQGYDHANNEFVFLPLGEIIDRRLHALPKTAAQILKFVAVAGKAFPIEDLQAVCQVDDIHGTVIKMRSESLARLIGSHQQPSVDTFHDKIRETVIARMSETEKRAGHLRFGEYLESKLDDTHRARVATNFDESLSAHASFDTPIPNVFDLAFHFFQSGDPKAFVYLIIAGEQAARSFAFETALEHLNHAMSVLPDDASTKIHFRMFERLGWVFARLQDSEKSTKFYELAREAAPSKTLRAQALLGLGLEYQRLGQIKKSESIFRKALNELGCKCPETSLGTFASLVLNSFRVFLLPENVQRKRAKEDAAISQLCSQVYFAIGSGAYDQSVFQYGQAIVSTARFGIESGDARTRSLGFSQMAGQFAWSSLSPLVRLFLGRSRIEADSTDIELRGQRELWEGMVLNNSGAFGEAIKKFENGIELSTRSGDQYIAACCAVIMTHTHGVASKSAEENKSAELNLKLSQRSGDQRAICWAEFCLAGSLARQGRLPEAHDWMRKAELKYSQEPYLLTEAIGRSLYSFVQLQSSNYQQALLEAESGWRLTAGRMAYIVFLIRNLPHLLEALCGSDWTEAKKFDRPWHLRKLMTQAWMFQNFKLLQAKILRARGRVYCRKGKPKIGRKLFLKAIAKARRYYAPFALARALLDLSAIDANCRDENRAEAIRLLKETESVIPRAESWLLGDQYDESVVAPEFDLKAWEREHGTTACLPGDSA